MRKAKAPMKDLFTGTGNWYKGNLHMHTTISDGRITPEEAKEIYQKAGYDFIAITDHRKPGKSGTYKNMLLLSGAEWDYGNNKDYPVYHILAIGTENDLDLPRYYANGELPNGNTILPQEIINRINQSGGLAVLAHPSWSVMNPEELFSMEGIAGAEIFNSVSEAPWNANRADSSQYIDIWASKGRYIPCTAADDSHWYAGEQTKSYIMALAGELSEKSILEAIRSGNFYASQGPEFNRISYNKEQVVVQCSKDVERMIFYSNSVWTEGRVIERPDGKGIYRIADSDRYIRIELIDAQGKRAWCSPFPV